MMKFLLSFFALFFSASMVFNVEAATCSRDEAKAAFDYIEFYKVEYGNACLEAGCMASPWTCLGRVRPY